MSDKDGRGQSLSDDNDIGCGWLIAIGIICFTILAVVKVIWGHQ